MFIAAKFVVSKLVTQSIFSMSPLSQFCYGEKELPLPEFGPRIVHPVAFPSLETNRLQPVSESEPRPCAFAAI